MNKGIEKSKCRANNRPGLPRCSQCDGVFDSEEKIIVIDDDEDAFAYHPGCYGYTNWGYKIAQEFKKNMQ